MLKVNLFIQSVYVFSGENLNKNIIKEIIKAWDCKISGKSILETLFFKLPPGPRPGAYSLP
jgi:hypothetical protein